MLSKPRPLSVAAAPESVVYSTSGTAAVVGAGARAGAAEGGAEAGEGGAEAGEAGAEPAATGPPGEAPWKAAFTEAAATGSRRARRDVRVIPAQ